MVNGYDAPPVDDVDFDTTEQGSAALAAERAHLDRVEAELRELAGHIYAAQARYLELVAEFDRFKGWAERGYRSANQWLSITVGAAPATAREQLRVAEALRAFHEAHAALARGELSYDKAAAATRMMTANNETDLVQVAIHAAPSDLRSMVAGYLAAERVRRIDAGDIADDPATPLPHRPLRRLRLAAAQGQARCRRGRAAQEGPGGGRRPALRPRPRGAVRARQRGARRRRPGGAGRDGAGVRRAAGHVRGRPLPGAGDRRCRHLGRPRRRRGHARGLGRHHAPGARAPHL